MNNSDQKKLEEAAHAIIKQQFERGLRQGVIGVTGTIYEMMKSSSSKEDGYDKVIEFCERTLNIVKNPSK